LQYTTDNSDIGDKGEVLKISMLHFCS